MRFATQIASLRQIFAWLLHLKSPWYYWYQGRKIVALVGMALGMGIMALVVLFTSGFNVLPLVLALVMDHVLLLIALSYVILRIYLPVYVNPSFADWFVLKQILFIVVPGILAVRITTMWVASAMSNTGRRSKSGLMGYRSNAVAHRNCDTKCRRT